MSFQNPEDLTTTWYEETVKELPAPELPDETLIFTSREIVVSNKPVAYRVENSGGLWLYFDARQKSLAERQARNYNPPHEVQPLYAK